MPVALRNTTTADAFPISGAGGAQIAGTDVFASGWFTVANKSVVCEYIYGGQGQEKISPEFFLAPGTYPIAGTEVNPVSGIRFRSSSAGVPAQVWGAFFYKNDPILSSSSEFSAQVAASGSITPGLAAVQIQKNGILIGQESALNFIVTGWTIADNNPQGRVDITIPVFVTGLVAPAGTIIAGNGYSVNRTGVGRYTITFTIAFAASPTNIASCIANTGNEDLTVNNSGGGGSFQVNIQEAGLAVDRGFNFISMQTI